MLPRLQAEEQLASIDGQVLCAGGFEPHDAKAKLQALQDKAAGLAGSDSRRRGGVRPSAEQLAAIGVGVTMVAAPETSASEASTSEIGNG